MKRATSSVIAVILLLTAIRHRAVLAQNQQHATPPEVKRTVDAFLGHWVLAVRDTELGAKVSAHFEITIDCKPAALGAAVTCGFASQVPGVGPIEAASVIGYSPDEQLVRWMEISSIGEYHDHKGRWKGNGIEFEPLAYSIGGKQATEYLSVSFASPDQMTLRSVTETVDGKSILECAGERLKSK